MVVAGVSSCSKKPRDERTTTSPPVAQLSTLDLRKRIERLAYPISLDNLSKELAVEISIESLVSRGLMVNNAGARLTGSVPLPEGKRLVISMKHLPKSPEWPHKDPMVDMVWIAAQESM